MEIRSDDDPARLEETLSFVRQGASVSIDIPVTVSAQDPENIAISIFEAMFICDVLTKALSEPRVQIHDDASNPNGQLVRLLGVVVDVEVLRSFFEEWSATLDPNGDGEPFVADDYGDRLWRRLQGKESMSAFRWPQLAEWFRSASDGEDVF